MFLVLGGWIVFGALFTGVRLLVIKVFTPRLTVELTQAFWVGWAATLCFLQVLELALPAAPWGAAFSAPVAVFGWLQFRRLRSMTTERRWVLPAVILPGAVWLALRAMGPPLNGDSGIYHRPAVRWMADHALAPGLANLNPLLGLNSAHFLYQALFEVGPWAHRSHHLGPSLLVLVLWIQIAAGLVDAWRKGASAPARSWIAALFLPLLVDQAVGRDLSTDTPDIAVAILGAAVWVELMELVERDVGALRPGLLVLISAMAIAVKLSYGPWAVLVVVSVAVVWTQQRGNPWPAFLALGLIGLATLGVWALRSAVLSGYPLYPSSFAALHVPWAVPLEVVTRVGRYVLAWGRATGGPVHPVIGTWDWIPAVFVFLLTLNRQVVLPLALALLALAFGAASKRFATPRLAWVLLPLVALGCWFLSAPDVRFAGALLWAVPVTLIWNLVREARAPLWNFRLGLVVLVALGIWPAWDSKLAGGWFATPASLPVPTLVHLTVDGPLPVGVPLDGSCWDAPAPCTDFPRAGLRMRGPAIEQGFEWGADLPLPPGIHSAAIPETP
jgi:hypothetical protein